jgi:Skp family chaperone for outer membrane proteins
MNTRGLSFVLVAALLASSPGCMRCGAYYDAMEKLGYEKRDLLVKRVDSAREAQQEAQQQFRDTLQEFQTLVGYKGGELESKYEKLRGEYEDASSRAEAVRTRIANVRDVANRLFQEWSTEIGQFTSNDLRVESQRELDLTRRRYQEVLTVMERASKRMDPVLAKLNDQVLFLKHNLNARALGSLKTTAEALQVEVGKLVTDMEASIAEASKFIDEMGKQPDNPS